MLLKGGNSIFSKLRSLGKNGNPKQEALRKILLKTITKIMIQITIIIGKKCLTN